MKGFAAAGLENRVLIASSSRVRYRLSLDMDRACYARNSGAGAPRLVFLCVILLL